MSGAPSQWMPVRATASKRVSPPLLAKGRSVVGAVKSSPTGSHAPLIRNSGQASGTCSGTNGLRRGKRGYQNAPSTSSPRTRVRTRTARATASSAAIR